jgi:hypothetical protein
MKVWMWIVTATLGLMLIVKLANEKFNGMAYFFGGMLLTVLGLAASDAGFNNGIEAYEKGWVARRSDGGLYPTEKTPFVQEFLKSPVLPAPLPLCEDVFNTGFVEGARHVGNA